MADNPYSGLLGIMREQGAKDNPGTICIGTVINPDPLTIKTEDLTLYHDDLYVSDILVKGYKRELIVESTGTMDVTGNCTINTDTSIQGTFEAKGELEGDLESITQEGGADLHKHKIKDPYKLKGKIKIEGNSNSGEGAKNETYLEGDYNYKGESKVEFKPYLQPGDLMAMMPTENGQKYIVLCKVVSV